MKKYKTDDPCTTCFAETENGNVLHHIKTRGSGGTDDEFNLLPLCQPCHVLIHKKGTNWMAGRFPSLVSWFHINDWEFNEFLNKWVHNG